MIAHRTDDTARRALPLGREAGIETARLCLRRPQLGDADAIALVLSGHETARMLPSLPFPYDRQDALEWLLPRASGVSAGSAYAITRRGSDDLIGVASIEPVNGRFVLGYWLAPAHRGEGLMAEALRPMLEEFFADRPDGVLHAAVLVDNPASFAIQAKLGFRVIGCRDVYCNARGAMKNMLETVLERADFEAP